MAEGGRFSTHVYHFCFLTPHRNSRKSNVLSKVSGFLLKASMAEKKKLQYFESHIAEKRGVSSFRSTEKVESSARHAKAQNKPICTAKLSKMRGFEASTSSAAKERGKGRILKHACWSVLQTAARTAGAARWSQKRKFFFMAVFFFIVHKPKLILCLG